MEIQGNQIVAATGKTLYRKTDTERQTPIKKCILLTGETSDSFVEIDDADIPAPSDTPAVPYEERVKNLIRERYSVSDEIALLRQQKTKPEEFEEYFAFAEACKAKAREETI